MTQDKKVEEKESRPYYKGLGRRKRATAQVRLYKGAGKFEVNGREIDDYFPNEIARQRMLAPLTETGMKEEFDITVLTTGGGLTGQADAVRLGIARALLVFNEDYRPALKASGFLTRDARKKERKKPGLKKARKAPQWSKR